MAHAGTVTRMDAEPQEAQRLATEARDRVRFEEDALALSDQVYRVARHLADSREDADELDAGDVRAGVPQLALVHARHEHARVAAADPDEPQHRPRAAQAAGTADAAARGERLLPLRPARGERGRRSDEEQVVERCRRTTS